MDEMKRKNEVFSALFCMIWEWAAARGIREICGNIAERSMNREFRRYREDARGNARKRIQDHKKCEKASILERRNARRAFRFVKAFGLRTFLENGN
jgi:plasmid stabilization system protein ParE